MAAEQTGKAATPSGQYYYGTGRRKTAIARVRLYGGAGEMVVNDKGYLDVFTRPAHQIRVRSPLEVAEAAGKFDVHAKINGGGITAWADALRLRLKVALMWTLAVAARSSRATGGRA